MPSVLLGLGDYRFSVATAAYNTLRRQDEYRWAKADRIGRAPSMQFLGPGSQSITLAGTVYPLNRGGIGQLDAMRKEAGAGKPLTMASGRGDVLGRWCIVRVEETGSYHLSDGVPQKQEFTLTIEAYGEDDQVGSEGVVKASAPKAASVLSEAKAAEAVKPIAQAAAAAGVSASEAAGTLQSMASQLHSVIADGKGLAQRVGDAALSSLGLDRAALTSQFKTDAAAAVASVVEAANRSGLLRDEALEQIFGPTVAADAKQLADAAKVASEAGAGWAA